ATALDPGREEAEKRGRRAARPDEASAGIAPEHGLGGKRKGRLIKDVRLERARRKRPPFVGERGHLRKHPPLDTKRGFDRAVHGSTLRPAEDENVEPEPVLGDDEKQNRLDDQRGRGRDRKSVV